MSDPVSNHDIEDVLSSIRRLVAQGNQEIKPEIVEKTLRAVESEPIDRLVLTPAFRVPDTVTDSPESDVLKMPPDFTPQDDTQNDKTVPGLSTLDFPTAPQPSMHAEDTVDRASLEATIAELEAAVTEAEDEWEPDGSETLMESSVTSAFLHKLDARQSKSPEDTVADAVADHIADTIVDEVAQGLAEQAEPVEATVDAVEDVAVAEDDVAFSHTRFDEVYDPVAEATADAAEKEPGDVFGDELVPDVDPTFGAVATPANGQLVDPDALRALVGEMIREELQGEMGERITRNVRKLVRREINRVITEQDV
ncbi:hypothetical protein MWU61_14310 [Loktanella sp. F6476L]|uniref:hypothetical protein n=1 Tax=Loktanella sp. F6476L TaxID=2926405 RepID=UPI001FF55A02|nr:hypothetical protein [Loktanella sp. F6476L]MCK0121721.1 hypothetical protein [Loktanella sp. F6476L]